VIKVLGGPAKKTNSWLATRLTAMSTGRLELLVEPFKENEPGPHVIAVTAALEARGLTVDMGPFSTTVDGEIEELISVVEVLLQAGFAAGASSIQTRLERT
jgi:uncharacterized protein YqgV (UPF0045/DUF77 family)